jgi:omega-amidase
MVVKIFRVYLRHMNIATVAHNTIWKDIEANIKATDQHISHVLGRQSNTDIILFPEISLSGIVEEESNKDIALTVEEMLAKLAPLAIKHKVAFICGFIEKNHTEKPFNSVIAISKDGKLLANYSKNHLFTQSAEPDFFSTGDGLATFELGGWKCGLSICFDIRFPRLYATYKSAGVECVFVANNWVKGRNKPGILEHLVKTRAHENQYFMVAVDRTGHDPTTEYSNGVTVISNPYAEDIATRDGIYSYATLDKKEIETLSSMLPLAGSFKEKYKLT